MTPVSLLRRAAIIVATLALAPMCGASSSDPHDGAAQEPRVCEPGRQVECSCLGARDGVQICNDSGTAYLPCLCEDSAPQGGVGAAGGLATAPMSGTAGTGGTSSDGGETVDGG